MFEEGHADQAFLAAHTPRRRSPARGGPALDDRARGGGSGDRSRPRSAGWPISTCSRRRRWSGAAGASSATATAAAPRRPSSRCPSVGGKFGVRGGGYSMSNSMAFGLKSAALDRHARAGDAPGQHEPPRPRAARVQDPAGQHAVRLQLQSAGDHARSEPRARRVCSATTSSPSSSSRSSPTPRATPTWCCRPRRSSSTTTSPRATGRSRCSSCGRSSSRSARRAPTPTCSRSWPSGWASDRRRTRPRR